MGAGRERAHMSRVSRAASYRSRFAANCVSLVEMSSSRVPPQTSRMGEVELAEKFEVSRSPVREALLALEKEGTVIMSPYKGAILKPLSAAEVLDIAELRLASSLWPSNRRTITSPTTVSCAWASDWVFRTIYYNPRTLYRKAMQLKSNAGRTKEASPIELDPQVSLALTPTGPLVYQWQGST